MARGKQLTRQIEVEECNILQAKEEFYKNNKAKGLSEQTQKGYISYIDSFADWCGNDTLMSDINVKKLDEYLYSKSQTGVKDVTLATTMIHIRRFINFCILREYMPKIVVTIPKYEITLKEPYDEDEIKLLLAKPSSDRWVEWRCWAMTSYMFSTGQRLSTILNIKIIDLDLDNAKVKLTWNKDKRQKYMPLSTATVKVLREYISLSDLQEQDYLFPEYEGKQLKKRSAEDSMTDYNHSRGVSKTGIHRWRHTFAKNYIINGGNPVKLQKLLNHKTIEQTMKYVNLYSTDFADDLDLFNPLDNFKRKNYIPMKRKKVMQEE